MIGRLRQRLVESPRWRSFGVGLLVATTVAACGGGGGGGGGGGAVPPPTTPPPPQRAFSWTADGNPGAQTIFLDVRGNGNPDRFVIQVRANNVTDLYGIALDVIYPTDLVDFDIDGAVEGGFFPAGGGFQTEFQITEQPAGTIIIANTRTGGVGGRNGDGLILELPFDSVASGTGTLTIDRELAIASDGAPLGITWLGGTFEIQR